MPAGVLGIGPFYGATVNTMRLLHYVTTLAGGLLLIVHVYLGTIAYPGTLGAMLHGHVSRACHEATNRKALLQVPRPRGLRKGLGRDRRPDAAAFRPMIRAKGGCYHHFFSQPSLKTGQRDRGDETDPTTAQQRDRHPPDSGADTLPVAALFVEDAGLARHAVAREQA